MTSLGQGCRFLGGREGPFANDTLRVCNPVVRVVSRQLNHGFEDLLRETLVVVGRMRCPRPPRRCSEQRYARDPPQAPTTPPAAQAPLLRQEGREPLLPASHETGQRRKRRGSVAQSTN